jgi:hypothetical protein
MRDIQGYRVLFKYTRKFFLELYDTGDSGMSLGGEILYAIEQRGSFCCISFKSHSLGLFHGGRILMALEG